MIRFIYGDFGFGKTHEIINMLKIDAEAGTHSFLIVPEQQAVSTERALLYSLPPSAQLTTEVLSFSRLYNRVCREYGGLEYNYITTPAKHLLMWKNLRELSPLLEHYKASEDDSALTEIMLSAIGECKASSISPAKLESATEKLDKNSEFYHKLRDISLIYSLYNNSVSEKFSDSADDISKLADILGEHSFFKGCNVYIDAFTSFTAAEHSVIDEILAQAENTILSLPLPEPRFDSIYTASITASERRLIRSADAHGGAEVSILTENKRAKSPALAYLSKNLWRMSSTEAFSGDVEGAVTLEAAKDPYAEAEAAARWTRALMKEGMRCRDIVVIARDAEAYRGIIEPAFEREGVPFFFSEKSDLPSKSAIKFILSALMIKNRGWRASDVISHIKCGFYELSEEQIDVFESYVNTWNIRGSAFTEDYWSMNPDGYSAAMSARGSHILTLANQVRETLKAKLIPLFAQLDAANGATEACRAIYEYLQSCGIEEKITELARASATRGNTKEAEEYLSLYSVILSSLSLTAEILGELEMSTSELASALSIVFEQSEIGTIPTSVDQVTIGSASMLRANSPRAVILLGLCDGDFPKTITDTGLLGSPEREILADLGLEFSEDLEIKMSEELLFLQRAISLPSERLILITSRAEVSGRAKQPSLAYTRTKVLLPYAREHSFDERDLSYLSPSKESAIRYLYTLEGAEKRAALKEALLYSGEDEALVSAPQKDLSTGECSVSEETASLVFPRDLELSQSRLEKFVNCRFGYYCSYVLKLREEKSAEFRSAEIGTFIHFILEHLIKELVAEDKPLSELDEARICELTDAATERYVSFVCPESKRNKGSFIHLYRRLRNLSLLLAKNIIEEFSHSEFSPEFFELKIGSGGAPRLRFALKDGGSVSLGGVVDRVDVLRRDGQIYVRVVDYKTGSKDFSLDDLSLGLNTQMLIYLFALCSDKAKRVFRRGDTDVGEILPAGIVYLSSNIPTVELEDYKDSGEVLSLATSALDRNGLLLDDEDILTAMNDALSPSFLAGVKKDKKGELVGKALTSYEKFSEIREQIEETITSIAEQMKCGSANADPLLHKKTLPCDFCEMKPICRRLEKSAKF